MTPRLGSTALDVGASTTEAMRPTAAMSHEKELQGIEGFMRATSRRPAEYYYSAQRDCPWGARKLSEACWPQPMTPAPSLSCDSASRAIRKPDRRSRKIHLRIWIKVLPDPGVRILPDTQGTQARRDSQGCIGRCPQSGAAVVRARRVNGADRVRRGQMMRGLPGCRIHDSPMAGTNSRAGHSSRRPQR